MIRTSRVKSVEETVRSCRIGVVQGAVRTKLYWVEKGFSEAHSLENAIGYAIGQLFRMRRWAEYDSEACAKIFREMAVICDALATPLETVPKEGDL